METVNNMITNKHAKSFAPEYEGKVQFTVFDSITGEVLDEQQKGFLVDLHSHNDYDDYKNNTATFDSRRAHSHNMVPGDDQFKLTRVEWGWGSNLADRENTDLAGAFAPAIYTPIDSYEFPTTQHNVLKVSTLLSTETLIFPPSAGSPPYPYVREVALRSNPTVNFPKGLMYARFVSDADLPKTTTRIHIRLIWVYIFK